jgi:predicted nucleic acid-binding protein
VTRYLVDTNVISTTAPTTAVKRREVVECMDSHSPDLFLSAVSIAEIADGIAKAKREAARRKASKLSAWLRTVLHLYGDRVLSFDTPTAEIAGALADLARGRGHSPGFADIAIAATARRHGLTILSRNERHFAPMDVTVVDPFHKLPTGTSGHGGKL